MEQGDTITLVGALITAVASLVGFIKIILPAIGERIARTQNIKVQELQHDLNKERKEDALSISIKEFITQEAQANIKSVREIAEECRQEVSELRGENKQALIELAEFRILDTVRQQEIERIRARFDENSKLVESLRRRVHELERLLSQVTKESAKLKVQLDSEHKLRLLTEKQANVYAAEIVTLKEQIAMSKIREEKVTREREALRTKLWEYRRELRDLKSPNEDEEQQEEVDSKAKTESRVKRTDTDTLLLLIEDDKPVKGDTEELLNRE